ncbi:MAG: glycoside hydrolase family 130 protein [Chthoniobacterales bacterium]
MVKVERTRIILKPDSSRVFFRPLDFMSKERITRIVARVMALSEKETEREYERIILGFGDRHQKLCDFFMLRFRAVQNELFTDEPLSENRMCLLGAYFSQEYALEAAALFNPSMVPHPDQSDLPEGSVRFVLSLRATGEGHISSIVFRSGTIDKDGNIDVAKPTPFVTAPEVRHDLVYEKALFQRKLVELGMLNQFAETTLKELSATFTFAELHTCIERMLKRDRSVSPNHHPVAEELISLARANYEIEFRAEQRMSERVIFPHTPAETKGIEDARFVLFKEEDGTTCYYATYTAFDGNVILPQMLETKDFLIFKVNTLNGSEIQNKGMALFPRRINGHYAMISRQDGENLFIMFSDMLHFWYKKEVLLHPTYPWEFVQLGNCGSPIETEAGWLLLTHGVGPMRQYCMGAVLLDLNDPTKVIGRLREPLLKPSKSEREGYVPNVVYSCGAMIHNGKLILPYAMSDQFSSFAIVDMKELLEELLRHPVR